MARGFHTRLDVILPVGEKSNEVKNGNGKTIGGGERECQKSPGSPAQKTGQWDEAETNAERAALRVGLRDGPNTSLVEIPHLRDVLAHRLSGDGERVEPQCSRFPRQLFEQRWNAARGVDVLNVPLPVAIQNASFRKSSRT